MPGGRRRKYPWADWADGSRHDIARGTDFDPPVLNMIGLMHRHAVRTGQRVVTRNMSDTVIRFQYLPRYWWE